MKIRISNEQVDEQERQVSSLLKSYIKQQRQGVEPFASMSNDEMIQKARSEVGDVSRAEEVGPDWETSDFEDLTPEALEADAARAAEKAIPKLHDLLNAD